MESKEIEPTVLYLSSLLKRSSGLGSTWIRDVVVIHTRSYEETIDVNVIGIKGRSMQSLGRI